MSTPLNFHTNFTRLIIPELDGCDVASLAADVSGECLITGRLSLERSMNGNQVEVVRSMTLVRHFLLHSQHEVFETDLQLDESAGQIVDMYVLSPNRVVFLTFNPDSRVFGQHLLELIPPSLLKYPQFGHGFAVTVTVRRITFNRLIPPVTISVGQLPLSGRILVVGKHGEEFPFRTRGGQIYETVELHSIAANPLQVDTIPDQDLTNEARRLCELAARRDLSVLPRYASIQSNGDIHFFLHWKGEQMNHFRTSNMAILELDAKNRYQARIIDAKHDKESIYPEMLPTELLLGACHGGDSTTYLEFLLPDTEVMNGWGYTIRSWLYYTELGLIKVLAHVFLLSRHLFGASLLRLFLKTLIYLYGDQILPIRPQPAYILVLSYNAERKVYRKVEEACKKMEVDLLNIKGLPRIEATAKELLQVSYPCFCRDAVNSNYVVKSFCDPFVPPTLQRAAQSAISKSFPAQRLFTQDFRRRLGLSDSFTFNNYRYMI